MYNRHQPLPAHVARELYPSYNIPDHLQNQHCSPLRENSSSYYECQSRDPYHVASQYLTKSLPVNCPTCIPTNIRPGEARSPSPAYLNMQNLNPTHQMSQPTIKGAPMISPRLRNSINGLTQVSQYPPRVNPTTMGQHKPFQPDSAPENNNTVLLRTEIELLNKRLDAIDTHCKDFARMAEEKARLEDNLRNLAYLTMLDEE